MLEEIGEGMKVAYGWTEGVNLSNIGLKIPGFWCALAKRPTEKELQEMIEREKVGRGCTAYQILDEGVEAPEQRTMLGRFARLNNEK